MPFFMPILCHDNLKRKIRCLHAEKRNFNEQGFETRKWNGYYVALAIDLPIYQDSKKTKRLVFNPVVFNEAVRAKDWTNMH